jgi:hypothetical protein
VFIDRTLDSRIDEYVDSAKNFEFFALEEKWKRKIHKRFSNVFMKPDFSSLKTWNNKNHEKEMEGGTLL